MPRVTADLAKKAQVYAERVPNWEVCGVFFFPQLGLDIEPEFIEIPNRHPEFVDHWQIDYDDLEDEILAYCEAKGTFAIFHSHPHDSGQPSPDDVHGIETFAKEMDGHPLWTPTERHLIFSLWDHSWWWYDLETFGRVTSWPAQN
jgi:proteasome lid subunit RPN8/RPN11